MSYQQKDGQGSLFKNDKAGVETRPDYKGSITVNGQEFWLSAWIKEGDKGKWMSLATQPKEARAPATAPRQAPAPKAADFDDDIPF